MFEKISDFEELRPLCGSKGSINLPPMSFSKLWGLIVLRGITLKDLSAKSGVCMTTLNKMRRGEMVGLDVLFRITDTLGCGLVDICDLVPPEPGDKS